MFKVTAMKVCIAQAYTNTLVLFYGYLNALSSTCAIKCYLEQIVGKIKKKKCLRPYHNHNGVGWMEILF